MARRAKHDDKQTMERAMALFWRQGYAATSLKDIETALDLGPGSIYARFGSKAGAYEAALAHYAQARRTDFEAHLAAAPHVIEGLAAYVRSLSNICAPNQPSPACMVMKSMTEFVGVEPALYARAAALLADTEAMFVDAFTRAQAAGEIAPDIDTAFMAASIQAEIMGIRTYAQKAGSEATVSRMIEALACQIEALAEPAKR